MNCKVNGILNGFISRGVKECHIDASGHLIFTMTDGEELDLGFMGPRGTGITNVEVNEDGTLTINYDDGESETVGEDVYSALHALVEQAEDYKDDASVSATAAENSATAAASSASSAYTAEVALEAAIVENPGSIVVDPTFTIAGAAAEAQAVGSINQAIGTIPSGFPQEALTLVSGSMSSGGALTSPNDRIRTDQGTGIKVEKGDFYFVDSIYEARVVIYGTKTMQTSTYIDHVTDDWINGILAIPDDYIGKYASIQIRKAGHIDDDISADVPTITNHVKFYSFANVLDGLNDLDTNKADKDEVEAEIDEVYNDIDKIQSDIGTPTYKTPEGLTKATGGFSGDVGEPIQANTTSSWQKAIFTPVAGKYYKFTFTCRNNVGDIATIKTVDSNGIVLEDLDIIPGGTESHEMVTVHSFDDDVAQVWCRGRSGEEYPMTVEQEITHIETMQEEINDLKDLKIWRDVAKDITRSSGGFTGAVGEQIQTTGSASYKRAIFKPVHGRKYRFSMYNIESVELDIAYIKTVDDNGIVLEDLDVVPVHTPSGLITSLHVFDDDVAEVWVRGKAADEYPLTIEEYVKDYEHIEEKVNRDTEYYECAIPEPEDYTESVYTDVYDAYDDLCSAYPSFIEKMDDLGNDADGNPICHYRVRKNQGIVRTVNGTVNVYDDYCETKRILLVSGVHGNEKSAVWGLFFFIRDYLSCRNLWTLPIETNTVLDVVPMVNPWGYDNNSRNNKNGVNINRNYQKENPEPETSAVLSLIASFDGDLFAAFDSHSTTGTRGYVSTRETSPIINDIMKMATDRISVCATRWDELAAILEYPKSRYPYEFGCLSVNDGTLIDYLIDAGITLYAITVETVKHDGDKMSVAGKVNADLIGNLVLDIIKKQKSIST